MSSEYNLSLKATLDTSEVQQKLQQLGQAGADANNQIDQAVQKLDKSIKELNQSLSKSAQQQANFGNTLKTLTRGAGAALVGQVIQAGGRLASATGHESIATGTDYAGAALKGAGMGAALGSTVPIVGTTVGAAVGAAVGTLNEAFEKLAQSAEDAARKLVEITQSEQRTNNLFEDVVLAENMAKFKDMDASQLAEQRGYWENQQFDYVNLVKQGRQPNQDQLVYEQQLAAMKEEYDKASQQLAAINAVEEQRKQEKEKSLQAAKREAAAEQRKADAAKKQEEAEQRKADAAKKQEEDAAKKQEEAEEKAHTAQIEAITKSAAGMLGSFAQQQRLEAFGTGLENMSVSDLQNLKESLTGQKSTLAGRATDLLQYAQTTGSAADLEAAQSAMSEFSEASRMLQMVETTLGGTSGRLSWLESMQALGTDAQKGYDTSGYGSIDQQMLRFEQETKDATKESASTLRSIDTKLDEVKNVITSNGNTAPWG